MKITEKYDFFYVGQRHAKDGLDELINMAQSYEKKYGKKARSDFELGVASVYPQYADCFPIFKGQDEIRVEGGTKNFGVDNTRNNSYFGGYGTGKQFISGVYNDEEEIKHSR